MQGRTAGAVLITLALGICATAGVALAAPGEEAPTTPAEPEAKPKTAAEVSKELSSAYRAARVAYSKAYRAAREAHGDDWRQHAGPTPEQQILPRYEVAAAQFAGTEDAVAFLQQVVNIGQRAGKIDVAKAALKTLVTTHLTSPKLSGLTYTLIRGDRLLGKPLVDASLETILGKTPHDSVKSAMLFARGARTNTPKASAETKAAGIADLRQAAELGGESTYAQRALSTIFEMERLQIGMTAPDIVGNDLKGVAFKLSDYRGKVVVLDFWGDW